MVGELGEVDAGAVAVAGVGDDGWVRVLARHRARVERWEARERAREEREQARAEREAQRERALAVVRQATEVAVEAQAELERVTVAELEAGHLSEVAAAEVVGRDRYTVRGWRGKVRNRPDKPLPLAPGVYVNGKRVDG